MATEQKLLLADLLLENFAAGVEMIQNSISGGYEEPLKQVIESDSAVRTYRQIGVVYPKLNREQRDAVLEKILFYFDSARNDYGQRAMKKIREPLLGEDIHILRWQYWPGLDGQEGDRFVKQYKTFDAVRAEIIDERGLFIPEKVESDYLVAATFLRSDMCGFGEDYVRVANAEFIDRMMQAEVANRFAKRRGQTEELSQEQIEKRITRLKVLLPKSLHDRIEPLRLQDNWVDWKKFD